MEIKNITFEWQQVLDNPLFKTYRVICTIETKENVKVQGSTDAKIQSIELDRKIISTLMLDNPEKAERRAFDHANDMLFRATGEFGYEPPRRRYRSEEE